MDSLAAFQLYRRVCGPADALTGRTTADQDTARGSRVQIRELFFPDDSPRYCLGAASATDFMAANPCSNWPPTILSMFMKRWIALAMKLFLPNMLHVTAVLIAAGLYGNSSARGGAQG